VILTREVFLNPTNCQIVKFETLTSVTSAKVLDITNAIFTTIITLGIHSEHRL